MQHFGFFFRGRVFPLRHIIVVIVQMPEGKRVAVEGAQKTKLELSVAVIGVATLEAAARKQRFPSTVISVIA
jgi:hypothetical protein